jgi:hypothetical protein
VTDFDELDVALRVARAFETLGLRYLFGGSLASSLHGIPRSSHDADVLADLPASRVDGFVRLLQDDFYVDAEMIRDAIRRRIAFNVIHYDSGFKVDVFILTDDPLLQEEMRRRQPHDAGHPDGPAYFATAEDMVLQKLRWYRAGGETSERQWSDVLGILAVQAERIDLDYLGRWAQHAEVEDLLERALAEGGESPD